MTNKDAWDLESAMTILNHPTVDSETWAEAVEWLLIYGPPEIRELLLQAASNATNEKFPQLKATGYTADGQPCYDVEAVAQSLNISIDEAKKIIAEKEKAHGVHQFVDENETWKIQ